MKANLGKRLCSCLLAITLIVSFLPNQVLALGEGGNSPSPASPVATAEELETALAGGQSAILITADFAIDRTMFVTASTHIYAQSAHTLTRAADFAGDLFVVGVNSAGEAAATPVALELGEENGASLTIDGNKANLEESLSVSGTALYVSNDSAVTIHDDVTFANHRKTENVRTIADGLGSAANIGGAAIIAASGSVTITGATFENNESVGEGGAVYLAADATTAITDAEFSGNKATGDNGSGGALGLRSAEATLEDVCFENNESAKNGGALHISYTSASQHNADVTAEGCTFTNNTAGNHGGAIYTASYELDELTPSVTVSDASFESNAATGNGGAFYTTGSNVSITDAEFVGNTASSDTYGGGALYSTGSRVDINRAIFSQNSANNGGAIALYSSSQAKFNELIASDNAATGNGGVLYNSGSQLNVYDSTWSENSAVSNGGAASLHSLGVSGFYNVTFHRNTAGKNGGALYDYTGNSITTVHSCTFTENDAAAGFGGALFASNASVLNVYNITAAGNNAKNGGVLYATTTATNVTLNGITVSGNTAVAGPIIYGNTTKAILNLNKANYTDSDVSGELDVTYWASAIANKLTVNEISDDIPGYYDYYGHYIGDSGDPQEAEQKVSSAEMLDAALKAELDEIEITADFAIDRTMFVTASTHIYAQSAHTLTRAADFAGDLFVVGVNSAGEAAATPVALELGEENGASLTIDGNKANLEESLSVSGTALYVSNDSAVTIHDDVTFANHRKTENVRTIADGLGSAANIGGAAIIAASGSVTITGATFENNESVGEGGAVYLAADATTAITDAEFSGNKATGDNGSGGALGLRSAEATLEDVCFENNESAKNGGALHISYTSASQHNADVTAEGCTFTNNTAGNHGGAIYTASYELDELTPSVTVSDASFESNAATGNGGAFYTTGSNVSITDAEFVGNTASSDTYGGGALYSTGSRVDINRAIFSQNSANNGGAIALYSSSQAKFNELIASDNAATGNGGVLYNSGSQLNVYDSTWSENSAVSNGGAASLHSLGVSGFYNVTFHRNTAGKNGGALYDYTGNSITTVHSCTFTENDAAAGFGGALFASNASVLNVYNITAAGNNAKNGGVLYATTTATNVTLNGITVSGNTAVAGPIIYGNTTKAILNLNKANYTDSDVSGELDATYWASAIANKLTVNEISDDIPGYYDYYGHYHTVENAVDGVADVRNADELEAAIAGGNEKIRVTADFEIDRTFYINATTTLYASSTHTLTRAADFGGDMFVVGESVDGQRAINSGRKAVFNLGDSESSVEDLLTIDGNRDSMTTDVSGTVVFICFSGAVNVYKDVSFVNHHKTSNERTTYERYGLPYTNRVGGAVAIIANGTLNIYGGRFISNSLNHESAVTEEDDSGRDSTLGAVIFNYSNLNVYDGLFEDNWAPRGGVIYNYRMNKIYGGTFRANWAEYYGGVIYQADSQYGETLIGVNCEETGKSVLFENNTAENAGGVLFTQTKNALIIYGGTTFRGNSSLGGNGGAIACYGTLTAFYAVFENNFAYQRGGAVYVSNKDDTMTTRYASFSHVTFRQNRAAKGGAIGVFSSDSGFSEGGKAVFTECVFEENAAVDPTANNQGTNIFGGAVYSDRKGYVRIADSTLSGNSAVDEGGAIYLAGESDVAIGGSTLSENTVSRAENGNGGAVSVHSATLAIRHTDINSNTATKNGGALYLSYTGSSEKNAEVTLKDVRFNQNTAANHGGALYATKHAVANDKPVLTSDHTFFTENSATHNGGAAYFTADAYAYFHDVSFTSNTSAAEATSSGSRYGGGALYITGAEVEINGATFDQNTSDYNAGAVGLYSSGKLTLNDATASQNTAANNGGFAYVNDATLNIYNSTLSQNSAKGGGALTIYTNGIANVYNTVFEDNTASGNGGALYAYTAGTNVLVQDSTFHANEAVNYGGAVYVSNESLLSLFDITATGNTALQGGFMYETTANTQVTLNGATVSGNAADAGPIIYGNSAKAILNLNKANYTDQDVSDELDSTYWASAIANKLKVVEISDSVPAYSDYSHADSGETPANPPAVSSVDTIFELAKHSANGPINTTFESYPSLDTSSNFMSLHTTEFENINGETVTVDSFITKPNTPDGNANFAEGLLIYQAMVYKKNHPDRDVSIDISSFRFSVDAAVCLNRSSRYFGYMRNLPTGIHYDKYGFVRVAYLLVQAARMGINVNVIGQMDAYPRTSTYTFESYFTDFLNAACDEQYVSGKTVKDYLDFNFCYWTAYGDEAATDMMHTKLCAVSNYTDMNGVDHANAVWSSSANLDGITPEGYNGNNNIQTGSLVSDHAKLYQVSHNYLTLMKQYCGQEDVYLFRELVSSRSSHQIDLISSGRENEIPADEQIVYIGTANDDVFELYFAPIGGDSGTWDEVCNPYCKYIAKLADSDDYVYFAWSNANFSYYPLSRMLLEKIADAFHHNKNPENQLFLLLTGADTSALNQQYSDLAVGTDIGSISINKKIHSGIHNKDIQLSYSENGERSYVTLLNSLNIHSGSMSYQSNFILVVKEKDCGENTVFRTFSDATTNVEVHHHYGDLLTQEPGGGQDGYTYRVCEECGDILIEQINHVPSDEWVVYKEATSTEKGILRRCCQNCGETLEVREYYSDENAAVAYRDENAGVSRERVVKVDTLSDSIHTFEAEISLPTTIEGRGGVIIGNYGVRGDVINLEVYEHGKLRLYTVRNKVSHSYLFDTDVRSSEPVSIILTVENTTARLYVNGVLTETLELADVLPDVKEGYLIGADQRGPDTPYFKGTIYAAALFSDVRTAEEAAIDRYLVSSDADHLVYKKDFGAESGSLCEGANKLSLINTTPLTIEATVKLSPSIVARGGVIVGNYSAMADGAGQYNFEIYYNGKPRLFYIAGDGYHDILFDTDIRSREEVSLALVVDGLSAKLYVNGVLKETKPLDHAVPSNAGDFRIGDDNRTAGNVNFKGTILKAALFEDVRTAAEIAADMTAVADNAEGLLYKYDLGEGDANVHTASDWIIDLPATTERAGVRHKECTKCGKILESASIPRLAVGRVSYDYCETDGLKIGTSDIDVTYLDKLKAAPHTFEATLQLDPSFNDRGGVIVGNYGFNLANPISVEVYTDGRLRLYYKNNSAEYNYIFNTDIRSADPIHIALTVNDTTATLYVDGVERESLAIGAPLPDTVSCFCVAGDERANNTQYFKGKLYGVSLFSDVRTPEELQLDRILVLSDSDHLLYSEYYNNAESTQTGGHIHTPSDVVFDVYPTGGNTGLCHTECSVCHRIMNAREISADSSREAETALHSRGLTLRGVSDAKTVDTLSDSIHTFEAEISLPTTIEGRGGVIIGNYGVRGDVINLEVYEHGKLRLYTVRNKVSHSYLFDTDVRSSEPVSIILTVENTTARLYVNGVLTETLELADVLPDVKEGYLIGADQRGPDTPYFKGTIYAAALFSDVRTAEEAAIDRYLVSSDADHLVYKKDFGAESGSLCEGANKLSLINTTPLTIEATVKLSPSIVARGGVIVGNYSAMADGAGQYNFEIYYNGKPRLFYIAGDGYHDILFDTDIRSREEVSLALVVDGLSAKLYVNGVLKETKPLDHAVPSNAGDFRIGDDNRTAGNVNFKGTILKAALFEDVRTAAEIAADMTAVADNAEGLLYKYDLGEGDANVHTASDWIIDLPATTERAGVRHKECTKCGKILEISVIPKLGSELFGYSLADMTGRTFTESEDSRIAVDPLGETPHTLEAVVYLPRSVSDRAGVVIGNYGSSCQEQINLEIYNNGRPRLYMQANDKSYDIIFNTDIRCDKPTHIAVTLSNGTATLYVDGEMRETAAVSAVLTEATSQYFIGGDSRTGNSQYFKGSVFSAALFSDVRTAEEIAYDSLLVTSDAAGLLFRTYL